MSDVIHVLGVPAGREVVVVVAATAGNVITNKAPGVGRRWLVLRGRIALTTNATAGNRILLLQLTEGTNVMETLWISGNIVASGGFTMSFGEVRVAPSTGTLGDTGYLGITGIMLHGLDQFRITISAGLAGDSYQGYLVVLETDE